MLSLPVNQLSAQQIVLESPSPSDQGPAGLPVLNPSKSFWIDTPDANPLAKEGSDGELTADADVCIIGSGFTGVSAAFHLSEAIKARGSTEAFNVVILEARDFCSGATGRNGGHLTPNVFLNFRKYVEKYGTDQALKSIAIEHYTVSALLGILESGSLADSVDLVAGGHGCLLFNEQYVREAEADFAAARAAGVDVSQVKWLSSKDVELRYGAPYPAVWSPGHNLWPLKLVTQLYHIAKSSSPNFSLNIHTCTPVTSIRPTTSTNPASSHRRWTLTTPRGDIKCTYVIHATNAYASHLLPHMQGPEGIIPTRGQVIALRANATLEDLTRTGWGVKEGFEYWFPRPVTNPATDNPLVILGGGREFANPKFEVYVEDDSVVNEDVGCALREFLPSILYGKFEEGREPEMEWTGIMGYTKLGDPFVGPVLDPSKPDENYKGQFIAAGYTGHGMPRAFACAQVVVQMLMAEHFGESFSIPSWFPQRYLTYVRDN